MYKSLKYMLLSSLPLFSIQLLANSVLEVTPSRLILNMAPGTSKTLDFTVSNNSAIDLQVTNIDVVSNLGSSLSGIITSDNCTNALLIKNNTNHCVVTTSITAANISTTIQGFFDIIACVNEGTVCSSSDVKAMINIGPGLPVELINYSVD